MNLIYMLLLGALDLAGAFFNMRMLLSCFRDRTKYTFLQKCRTLTVFQCVCQVTILVTNAVKSWKLFGFEIQRRDTGQSCDVLWALLISVMVFLACNYVILMGFSDDRMVNVNYAGASFKLKLLVLAALSLGLIGSAVIWYSCFSQEVLPQMAVKGVLIVVTMILSFVALLFALSSKDNIHVHPEDITAETSKKRYAYSLLSSVCRENMRSILFIAFLLICLAVILRELSRSSFSLNFEEAKFFLEVVYSLITRFVVGIVLPLTISDLIDESYVGENERPVLVV